jgi:hypothetical protein
VDPSIIKDYIDEDLIRLLNKCKILEPSTDEEIS